MAKQEIDARFNRFGTVSFAGVTRVNDFIGYLEAGKIMGTRCRNCGRRYFPPRADCCQCFASEMEWFEVLGEGKLVGFTTLQYAPTGFAEELPYTIALLDYERFKVFGRIDPSLAEADLALGMELKAAVDRTGNGRLTYMFRKA